VESIEKSSIIIGLIINEYISFWFLFGIPVEMVVASERSERATMKDIVRRTPHYDILCISNID
jgi:hypothetical protein